MRKKNIWKERGRCGVSLLLAVFFVYSLCNSVMPVFAKDITDILQHPSLTVTQAGEGISHEDGILNSRLPVQVDLLFSVPLYNESDGSQQNLAPDDTAYISLATGVILTTDHTQQLIYQEDGESICVGIAEFTTDSTTPSLGVKITLNDGLKKVYENESNTTLAISLGVGLEFSGLAEGDSDNTTTISILDKTFNVHIPAIDKEYSIAKTRGVDLAQQSIKWTVTVTGKQGENQIDLNGSTFQDDLRAVGDYIPGSFALGEGASASSAEPAYNEADKQLSYAFAEGTVSPQVLSFSTRIPEDALFGEGEQLITNTAELLVVGQEPIEDGATVSFTPLWIEKSGKDSQEGSSGPYDPTNQTITWTIIANHANATLENAQIVDTLLDGLQLKSASYQFEDSRGTYTPFTLGDGAAAYTYKVEGGKVTLGLGKLTKRITVQFVTTVPGEPQGPVVSSKEYKNAAKLVWAGRPGGIDTGEVKAKVGYNAISKVAGDYDVATASIPWTVSVNARQQAIPGMKVYDLLIYGSEALVYENLESDSLPPDMNAALFYQIQGEKKRQQSLNQHFIAGSFSNPTGGLSCSVTTIMSKGKAVADLLCISEISGAMDEAKTHTFGFTTQVSNPAVLLSTGWRDIKNVAVLFSGTTLLNHAESANVGIANTVVSKDALHRDEAKKLKEELIQIDKKQISIDRVSLDQYKLHAKLPEVFDYQDKDVIYRLHVNPEGINYTSYSTSIENPPGTFTLVDALPLGWEFKPLYKDAGGKEQFYIIRQGAGVGDVGKKTYVKAEALTVEKPTATPVVSTVTTEAASQTTGETLKITLPTLDKPYVVFLRAAPSAETAAKYFADNKLWAGTDTQNTFQLESELWGPLGVAKYSPEISSTILNKNFDKTLANSKAEVTWVVNYQPSNLPLATSDSAALILKDTLPLGLDLRIDSSGSLLINDNIKLEKLILQSDGSYTQSGQFVSLALGQNVFYDTEARVLSLKIPESAQAYRFTYITDITGDVGEVKNTVSLNASSLTQTNVEKKFQIEASYANVAVTKGGYLKITKIGAEAAEKLKGAEFKLLTKNGSTVIARGKTDASGQLTLRGIPVGNYILRETTAPDGYVLSNLRHSVAVTKNGSKFVTKIDNGSNEITITNTKQSGNTGGGETGGGNTGGSDTGGGNTDGSNTGGGKDPFKPTPEEPKPEDPKQEETVPEDPRQEEQNPEPTAPPIYRPTETLPAPADPNSPDSFTLIDENGVPLGNYTKVQKEDGTFEYIDEEGIPLGGMEPPRTGDESKPALWGMLTALSALCFLMIFDAGRKERKWQEDRISELRNHVQP